MNVYRFDERLKAGASGERVLDDYFARWFKIARVNRRGQRAGIDRVFHSRSNEDTWAVEYKTDYRAAQTGNAFVETVSVRQPGRNDVPGWAYKSQADRLIYYIPDDELIYIFTLDGLRSQLPRWEKEYPTRDIPNQGYVTVGLLVPLAEFEEHAASVISL